MIEPIDNLIYESMKSGNKTELNAYKNIKTELWKVLTAKNGPEYSEAIYLQVIAKYAKSLEDAILQFSEAHREDLVAEYTSELEVVRKLLPEPVNESRIHSELCIWAGENKFIKTFLTKDYGYSYDAIETSKPFIPKKEMGRAIKYIKSKLPTADGKLISEIVKRYII